MIRFLALLMAILTLAGPAAAEVTGQASVIDGDTLEIHGQRVRLHGIDSPESDQICRRDGMPWQCGREAANALADMIARRPVACEEQDRDRYGRIVAKCAVAGTDLGRWMVSNGLAVAYLQYSFDYASDEEDAKSAGRGVWSSEFVMPWDWRRGERLDSEAASDKATGECLIKGNVSSSGERIYHVPGGQYYFRTRISQGKGERWFCTEDEARAAGWRRSKR